jgi:hypothetical protein
MFLARVRFRAEPGDAGSVPDLFGIAQRIFGPVRSRRPIGGGRRGGGDQDADDAIASKVAAFDPPNLAPLGVALELMPPIWDPRECPVPKIQYTVQSRKHAGPYRNNSPL